ncbi:amidohydrolase family protein [Amycolatopsis sp. NPDC049253]|uniref:amidohydrolase family protein n=1 Tax=Amycolatopsis sp. NPDC049253 TaxID=3155274 RepID=UPI00341A72CD
MIIGVHGHAGSWFSSTEVGSVELNLALMDRYSLDRHVVSASEAVAYDMVSGNSRPAEVLETQPRLLGYVVVNPHDLAATAREPEKYRLADRYVKVHTTYPSRPLTSPAIRDARAPAAEAGLPALVHTGDETALGLVDVPERHPDLRAIAGHLGGPAWRTAVEAARRSDRFCLEPCCSITDRGRFRHALDRDPLEQMLFGTGSTPVDPAVAMGVVPESDLTDDEYDHVMGRNAARLLGLEGEEDPTA